MTLVCQTAGCDAPVAFVVSWRTHIMRASAFWYQCERCMCESVRVLRQDPNMKSLRVHARKFDTALLVERP